MEDVPKMVNLHEKRNGIEFRTDKNKKVYVYETKLKTNLKRISPR